MGMDKTARQVEVRMVNVSPQDRKQTKGTVLLVCLRCVDTLVFVLKHAEGESTENIRVFGGFLRARGVFLEKNDGDRGVFPVFG